MNMSLKKQLILIASMSIFAIILLIATSFFMVKKVAVGSDLHKQMVGGRELLIEIAPPALLLLEPTLMTFELTSLSRDDMQKQTKAIQKKLDAFGDAVDLWANKPALTDAQKQFLKKTVAPQAQELIDHIENVILPLAELGNVEEMNFANRKLAAYFHEHAGIMEEFMELSQKEITATTIQGEELISFYKTLLVVVSVLSAIGVAVISFVVAKRILSGLGVDPSELQSAAQKVTQGDFDVVLSTENSNSVASAMSAMISSIKSSTAQAATNFRIRSALDATSANIMLSDAGRNIIYMNKSVEKMLRGVESELRKALPHFAVDKIVGSNMDIFHKNPSHQSSLLSNLTGTYVSNIVVANLSFRLAASPIFSETGERLGSVVEWVDRTAEVQVESEVNHLVESAAAGDFSTRINTQGKNGFFLKLAEGLNQLVNTADQGLNDVARVLGAIAKGDLTEKIEAQYSGTFGDLKNYCNETTESLTVMMSDIRNAAETIFTASSEIAQGNADLSSRTEQQAANLEETASSMEELTSTVKLNADNAKQANVLAEKASSVATDGGSLIQQVVNTMNDINQSAQKISDIIGVIDGIAFQTNILALNAAVEAARAGDQGRGFAVVASEVRTLAQRSANAAKDIKALINDSVQKIESGNSLVNKSGETMKEIVNSIKRVNDIMSEIAAASNEQSTGIEEVSTAVSQMDEMTQQNAALVEEAAAAAESLQSQADQLTRNVGQFKLSSDQQSRFGSAPRLSSPTKSQSHSAPAVSAKPTKKLSPPKGNAEDEWETF